MNLITHASEMTRYSLEARKNNKNISCVPTMGALHEGHLALFREGKKLGRALVVSLFVNPTQFIQREDYEKYPRALEDDLKKCKIEDVDVVFAPLEKEIYPAHEKALFIPLPALALPLEGLYRPGHFAGVLSVVAKLFHVIRPHTAIFGMKDYQQMRVIEEMTKQQKLDVAIVRHAIVREKDGLAMSSRNALLSPAGRQKANVLFRSLQAATSLFSSFSSKDRQVFKIREAVLKILQKEKEVRVEYVALVDAETLTEIREFDKPALLAIAVWIEDVRLIDNRLLQ